MADGERWVMPKAGSLAGLAKEAFDTSSLEPDENCLLIRVHCIGLNFADIFAYSPPPPTARPDGLCSSPACARAHPCPA